MSGDYFKGQKVKMKTAGDEIFIVESVSVFVDMVKIDGVWIWIDLLTPVEDSDD